jgi:hypothetical protein
MSCRRGCCPTSADHYRSISVAASASPTRKVEVTRIDAKEKRWGRDMPAYRRLRREGLQPKQIDGSAVLEQRAETKDEVAAGTVLTDRQRRQLREVTGDHG